MAFLDFALAGPRPAFRFDTEKAVRAPIGAASPLWLAFAVAAGAGVAYWWATRWLRPARPEPAAAPEPEPAVEAAVIEAVEAIEIASAPEPAPESVAAKTPEPVAAVLKAESAAAEPAPAPKASAPGKPAACRGRPPKARV